MQADARKRLCISLHDVAPTTLQDCARVLDFLDGLNAGPVALLVVPDYHGSGRVDRSPRFISFIESRLRRGDEVVLHGLRHEDGGGAPQGPRDWVERRVLTAREGEFARLDAAAARARLLRGLAVLRAAGWRPRGFAAPAWLMSEGTLAALESLPFDYCVTRDAVMHLRSGRYIAAPSLVVSTRSSWRRLLSPAWNLARLSRTTREPVVRAALHPTDVLYPRIERLWASLLEPLLGTREVVTEAQLWDPASRSSARRAGSLSATKRLACRS
jgi:predicted deacetylase